MLWFSDLWSNYQVVKERTVERKKRNPKTFECLSYILSDFQWGNEYTPTSNYSSIAFGLKRSEFFPFKYLSVNVYK